ncbi:hydantoinase B/oxoprolinase family protein [Dyadobacter sp. CY312]|uniref:hydantoinase B/oxoprolinase family protein n=1 Tax=Dyadobacter sp. CY312 TaxID=2907303 RepID=UPI001F2E8049|nr:hydantoinase B/oxoprolinase family protein [Dyadobacter sp. CY312]MCE7043601.1 hydantoinase B/oxoprolinase family protein [Dyadobacter sp. CY312]
MATSSNPNWKINIDTGGTFTDCLATAPSGETLRIKVLSSSRLRGRVTEKAAPFIFRFEAPWLHESSVLAGYHLQINGVTAKLCSIDYGNSTLTADTDLDFAEATDFELYANEEAPVLAARLLTKTALNEPLPPIDMRLGTTRGTNALLERKGAKTLLVVTKGFKDLVYIGNQQRPSLFQLNIPEPRVLYCDVLEIDERLDADGNTIQQLDIPELDAIDFQSVAVSLLHSYKSDEHEISVADAFKQAGSKYVSTSASLFPFSHYLRRTQTAIVNAYLDPVLDTYLSNIKNTLQAGSLKIMTSTGSLAELAGFRAKDSLLSGPAGGMVAAANKARQLGIEKVLTFDMGGTSTDVARIDGEPELKYITEIDGIEFHNPTLAIETVAAGGGSVCWFDGFTLQVGPESAGASPGPACYGAGGPLTITDVNFLLGKLDPAKFGIPIRIDKAIEALEKLVLKIETSTGNSLTGYEILTGLERIANEKMADAIRKISVEKGISPEEYALITFGGAGGLHSCQLADLLDIKNVIIPYDAGLFSAVGIGESLVSTIVSKQVLQPWENAKAQVENWNEELIIQAKNILFQQKIKDYEIAFCSVFLRFTGQENAIDVAWQGAKTIDRFRELYSNQFGYYPENIPVELESIKIKVQEKAQVQPVNPQLRSGDPAAPIRKIQPEFSADKTSVNIYEWDALKSGDRINGPSILLNNTSTVFIPDNWELIIQSNKDASAFNLAQSGSHITEDKEEVALQLFTNRFEAIAEEMGAQLQRTAFSVNVKERLDFSCALLDSEGDLLVNAQHIPVHLGSMGICGRLVLDAIEIGPGDVVITNHPKYGGSHLPDVTLLSGVFTNEGECLGYVINRAHHAEIGGKTPGSMPPDATCLAEEGVVILPQYLVKNGEFQWENLNQLFTEASYPTRNFMSNEADILAALSALRKGSEQLLKLAETHGSSTIKKYMNLLKASAASQLKTTLLPLRGKTFHAVEFLDDDHRIQVSVSINDNKQIFDFTGTSPVHPNNLNANISILHSAILYVLRLLVNKKIPLNDGLMKHVEIILPENSFLHPQFSDDPLLCPAVVGGNTEVSQRLVDTLLKAFELAACSQGTMNNFLFGNKAFGYYETIGGGTGAGVDFNGRSAVHQHMTNTRITDPEQLERKYPVRLLEFGIRKNSGGKGKYKGGDGITRKVQFLENLQVTLLGQHRKYEPYGLEGGENGKCGEHTLQTNGTTLKLPGICSFEAQVGDVLLIETPGGGGFGLNES